MKTHPTKHHAPATHARPGKLSTGTKAKKPQFTVLSPDGLPIWPEPFDSYKAAKKFIPFWIDTYCRPQGFYASLHYGHIPLDVLPKCFDIEVLPADDEGEWPAEPF